MSYPWLQELNLSLCPVGPLGYILNFKLLEKRCLLVHFSLDFRMGMLAICATASNAATSVFRPRGLTPSSEKSAFLNETAKRSDTSTGTDHDDRPRGIGRQFKVGVTDVDRHVDSIVLARGPKISLFARRIVKSVWRLEIPEPPAFAILLNTELVQRRGNRIGTELRIPPITSSICNGGLVEIAVFSWSRREAILEETAVPQDRSIDAEERVGRGAHGWYGHRFGRFRTRWYLRQTR